TPVSWFVSARPSIGRVLAGDQYLCNERASRVSNSLASLEPPEQRGRFRRRLATELALKHGLEASELAHRGRSIAGPCPTEHERDVRLLVQLLLPKQSLERGRRLVEPLSLQQCGAERLEALRVQPGKSVANFETPVAERFALRELSAVERERG